MTTERERIQIAYLMTLGLTEREARLTIILNRKWED